jgi:hypothetical protein
MCFGESVGADPRAKAPPLSIALAGCEGNAAAFTLIVFNVMLGPG